MQYNPLNILLGITILFLFSFMLISVSSLVYLKWGAKKQLNKKRALLAFVIGALAWVVSTLISVLAASSLSTLVFGVFSFVLLFIFGYFYSEKLLCVDGKHKLFYPLILAGLFNPGWLVLVGII